MRTLSRLPLVGLVVALAGCDRAPQPEPLPVGHPAPELGQHRMPPGHPPVGGGLPGAASPAPAVRGLGWDSPAGWVSETPTSSMRRAQWRVPGPAGDASVAVFYFGGQGGSVEANLDRWYGQFEQPDGRATREVAQRTTRTVRGMSVTIVDVTGTFTAEMMPGSGQRQNLPNHRMLAAVVETPGGPYFVKLTGPSATVERARATFDTWLASLRHE